MDTYEKKYKESMAKMSAFLAKHDGFTISKDGEMYKELSEIFDELKESEDERMIQYFKDLAPFDKADELYEKYGFSHKDAIAWLEKQGKQKPTDEEMKILLQTEYEKGKADAIEQKSAWSEEDKRKINRIYSILGQAADTHAFSTTCRLIGDKECVDLQDFIKSITLQNTWKPSDEQIQALEYQVRSTYEGSWQYRASKELLEQLKKL